VEKTTIRNEDSAINLDAYKDGFVIQPEPSKEKLSTQPSH